jgi:membrane glycosyltransferase
MRGVGRGKTNQVMFRGGGAASGGGGRIRLEMVVLRWLFFFSLLFLFCSFFLLFLFLFLFLSFLSSLPYLFSRLRSGDGAGGAGGEVAVKKKKIVAIIFPIYAEAHVSSFSSRVLQRNQKGEEYGEKLRNLSLFSPYFSMLSLFFFPFFRSFLHFSLFLFL